MKAQQHNPLRWVRRCGAVAAVLALTLIPAQAQEVVDIQCSPSVVVLDSVASGDWLTVHTDIPLSAVDTDEPIYLNGVLVDYVKADNRGNLVAKFDLTELKALLAPPSTVLTLEGTTVEGLAFVGSDTVGVVESTPRVEPPKPKTQIMSRQKAQLKGQQLAQLRLRLADCE